MKGTHGCGLWKIIRKGADNFFGHVVYAMGEGNRIRFWHDPWSGPSPLKELYPELFACAMVQEALISDMVILHQMGEVGVGTSFSVAILMNGSGGDFILSMSIDRKSTRLNSSHRIASRMPSSA